MFRRAKASNITAYFCPKCVAVQECAPPPPSCEQCHIAMLPLYDSRGAMTREYLLARKVCCENGCRNCPYF